MEPANDPFSHHPELRGRITDPMQSYFRSFTPEGLAPQMEARGLRVDWWHSRGEREASRIEALSGRLDSDLWVFAYGSLMWDPAFRFEEVRRASISGHARRFILKDVYGGRGTAEAPGLMAALDAGAGAGCDGLAFRIARENIDEETEIVWRREKIGPAYTPVFVRALLSDRSVEALTFVADHDSEIIDAGLTREEQVRFLATGTGFIGSSLQYLENVASHLAALGIRDEEVSSLLSETEAYLKRR